MTISIGKKYPLFVDYGGGNSKIAPIVLIACVFVIILIARAESSSVMDSLERDVRSRLGSAKLDRDSLYSAYIAFVAKDDWSVVPWLSVAVSISFYDTPDSAIWDVAYALARSGKIGDALEVLKRGAEIVPKMSQTLFLTALCLAWQGKKKKAVVMLENALARVSSADENCFLKNALGTVLMIGGDVQEAFSVFRGADRLPNVSSSSRPFVEAKWIWSEVKDGFVAGEIELYHISGRPFVILQLLPKFISVDRREVMGEPLYIEQVAQIFGSPYWQPNVRRRGGVLFWRELGINLSFNVEFSAVVAYSDKKQDTLRISVVGPVGGVDELDSFAMAVHELEENNIEKWYSAISSSENIPSLNKGALYLTRTMAIAFVDSAMRDIALKVSDSVLSVSPYWNAMWQWRGAVALAHNDAESAVLSFLMSMKKDTCDEAAYYNAGVAHYLFGNFASAESLWKASVRCNPSFPPAILALGILNHDVKADTAKALEYYRKYLTLTSFIRYYVEEWITELEKK